MATAGEPGPNPTPQRVEVMLREIHAAISKDKRSRWAEITCAILLSLATTCSAWCAYQSTLWSGVQTFRLASANKASRLSTAAAFSAQHLRTFDASMFISYIQAKHQGNERQELFLFNRFRPEMKRAVEAWLKTDPFNNSNAPANPFRMAEYTQKELEDSRQLEEEYDRVYALAQQANRNADTYVLLTVLFAAVLFFGGIAGTVDSRRLRVIIVVIAIVLFLITLVVLETMPICRE